MVMQVPDDTYLANQTEIDDAVDKGDPAFFQKLKSVSMLTYPSVSTRPGLKATVDMVRVFPYPTSFDYPRLIPGSIGPGGKTPVVLNIPPTPRDFATKNIGVSAEITPGLDHEKIVLNGKLTTTIFEGMTRSNLGPQMPSFSTTETLFFEALDDGEFKGIWLPSTLQDVSSPQDKTVTTAASITSQKLVKVRTLVFLNAKLLQ
jgi:hypothetical protein